MNIRRRSAALARCIFVLAVSLALYGMGHRTDAGEGTRPSSFHVHKLETGWGTYDAEFSPNGQSLAVDAYRWEGTELVEQIQIWDFRSNQLLLSKTLSHQKMPKVDDAGLKRGFVRYADVGKKILVCACNVGRLFVLDSNTLSGLGSVDLERSAWPQFAPNSADEAANGVAAIAAAQDQNRAAVLLTWGLAKASELRVYDLTSGNLVRKWDFRNYGFGGISMDHRGENVAVSLLPFSPGERPLLKKENNVFVYDITSGQVISGFNTGYLTAQVHFIGENVLGTVSAEAGLGSHKKDGIRLWDVKTGKMLRQILSRPTGIRYYLDVSENGKIAFGYIPKEVNHWHWFDPASVITEHERFRLWDLTTGAVIATSPDLPSMNSSGFALSPNGSIVLTFPEKTGGPLTLYELSNTVG